MNLSTSPSQSFSKKALFIINPVSGKKLILKHIPTVIRCLMDKGYLVTTMVTGRHGEAAEFSSRYGREYDLVCCAGGDGTLSETLNGLARERINVPIGYIPCGSTNDFAVSHGLATDILKAAENMADSPIRSFDIGHFGDSYFSYVAAFGAFSWLSYTTDQNLKNKLGHTAYILDGIKDVYKIRPVHLRLRANGQEYESDYIFGAICNTLSIAGTIELPSRLVDGCDGKFELMLIKSPKTIAELDLIIRGIRSQDYSCPLIDFFQTDSLELDCPPGMEWALDGECFITNGPVEFSVVPGFLKLQG